MSRTLQDLSGSPVPAPNGQGGPLRKLGPRRIRTKIVALYSLLVVGAALAAYLLYVRRGALWTVGLGLIVVGILLAVALSGVITRPIVQMTRTAERLANGDLRQRARVYARDEIGILARTFNAMADGLEKTVLDLEERNRTLEEAASKHASELARDAEERLRIERELRLARVEIDRLVDQRTDELSRANVELHDQVLEKRRSEDYLQSTLDRLERSLEGTFRALALTLELRDPFMAGHQHRVASLAVAVAREMNLAWDQVEGLRFAASIHDIGKIAAPLEIVGKPGRLSTTELQLVKEHPRIGYEMIKDVPFPWPVAHIILQHHERLDGSGYPEGLAGEAILPEARVLAVADVVEALCSLRPYRPALGIEKALEEIRKGRSSRYDARAVDACTRLFRDKRFSFKTEKEAHAVQ
jgi:HD-GYP domain-containing protein (c-di-GMP phosphodiesterase class II)